ncbi:phenylacetate-coenzyme A ligase PaaK-like adenylate-forming protein [Paenibacillus sp. V4I9]|uniref:CoF synthetase n=1 Tax=Paenibacillus sp. V4I9 TaxID=3042308 RepID=UPI0027802107|nr:CoF synthetase [Paenibacillus sp. V4I9]MDQ0892430.1 phenylacetate-coenzyme A ligase PaaK-like adenylate-forming protein [Paenibacillus sp. V4I9]
MHIMETIHGMKRQFSWYPLGHDLERSDEESGALTALPLMSAATLETFYYTENNPFHQRADLNRYQTSGTSSKRRKTIFYSKSDEEAYLRIKLDIFRRILDGHKYRAAMADMGTGHAEATAVEVFRELGMEVETLSFQLPVEQHIERLASFRPEVLYTMPSILDRILLASVDPAAYGICHVILVGEIAAPGWIKRVAERLSIAEEQITDTYGSIEIGTIAYFSHEHRRYLFADGLLAEGVSAESLGEDLEPLTDEQEQVLILTSTVRDSFPALRYVTYDVVRDLRPIMVDGVPRQSFQSIVKRIGPDLKHGEKISIYDIEDVVYRHLGNASVRVNVAGNSLRVYVFSTNATTAVLESIRFDVENRIPEIGMMIRARILAGIQVIGGTFEDSLSRASVKNKKIFYT